jgi:hypothetical protein
MEPGADFLRRLGERFILPAAQKQQGEADRLSSLLFGELERPAGEAGLEFANKATSAFAEDLGRPGGPISKAIGGALRGTVQSGFRPGGSGKLVSDTFGIGREASRSVGNFFTQQALAGRGQDIQNRATLGQIAAGSREDMLNLIASLFSIGASAEQLGLQRYAIRRQT